MERIKNSLQNNTESDSESTLAPSPPLSQLSALAVREDLGQPMGSLWGLHPTAPSEVDLEGADVVQALLGQALGVVVNAVAPASAHARRRS
jgi:hypothetical protein